MVDWKKLGKKALEVSKDATEKGVDTFQEWKHDPERMAKAQKKKALKKANKQIEKEEKKESKIKVTKPLDSEMDNSTIIVKHVGKTTISLSDKAITIKRSGGLEIHKGTNIIPLKEITSIQLRPAGNIYAGYIHFSIPGSYPPKNGLTDATSDVNSVVFPKKYNKEMEQLKSRVENSILNFDTEA